MDGKESVKKWNEWLESEEGQKNATPYEGTLQRQYLQNRLWLAEVEEESQ